MTCSQNKHTFTYNETRTSSGRGSKKNRRFMTFASLGGTKTGLNFSVADFFYKKRRKKHNQENDDDDKMGAA